MNRILQHFIDTCYHNFFFFLAFSAERDLERCMHDFGGRRIERGYMSSISREQRRRDDANAMQRNQI